MKKKITALVLIAALLIGLLFSGCSRKSSADNCYTIPDDGVVKAATLQKVKDSGKIAIFKGESNKISYEWTFVGPDITEPEDINLKVNFTSNDEPLIRDQAAGQDVFLIVPSCQGEIPGDPTLSVTMGKQWSSGIYNLYSFGVQNKQAEFIKELRVVDGSASSFSQKNWNGNYFLTANPLDNAEQSTTLSTDSSVSSSTESSGGSSMDSSATTSENTVPSSNAAAFSSHSNSGSSRTSSSAKPASGGGTQVSSKTSSESPKSGSSDRTSSNPYDRDRDPQYSAGHPDPVDNGTKNTDQAAGCVTMSIRCDTAVKNWDNLKSNKQDHRVVPEDGCIFPTTTLNIYKGETVYDLLVYVCEHYRIHMQHKGTPIYGTEYIQGINNLYEFDCGKLSGWMYEVNGWYPNYGVSRYELKNGDKVEWNYTCDLGRDLGQNWLAGR